ncbi:hypothetical protein GCM10020331_062240 [Ectobacillus funiculus]
MIDGFICTTAALLAKEMCPDAVDYMVIGHRSAEIGHEAAVHLLGKKADFRLRISLRRSQRCGCCVSYSAVGSSHA